jgi:hypothetical protein
VEVVSGKARPRHGLIGSSGSQYDLVNIFSPVGATRHRALPGTPVLCLHLVLTTFVAMGERIALVAFERVKN